MGWTIFICVSAAVLLVGIIACVCCAVIPKLKKRGVAFWVFAAGVAVSAFALVYPYNAELLEDYDGFKTTALSLLNTAELFGIGDYYSYRDALMQSGAPKLTVALGSAYAAVIFVLAPFVTAGVVLAVFKGISNRLRWACAYFKDAYVFAELNDKTVALAQDLKRNGKCRAIVFCGVDGEAENANAEHLGDARVLNAICFKGNILSGVFSFHSKNKQLNFFLTGEDDAENVKKALVIIKRYQTRKNAGLYIFSATTQSELVLAAHETGEMKIRRINPQKALVYNWLFEHGAEIFERAKAQGNGNISAVVVGLGGYGKETVKALTWYCQMDGYTVTIDAFDADKRAESKFTALCPEIMSKRYNGVQREGEAAYTVRVHSDMDVHTAEFEKAVSLITGATLVVVALGDDELNIRTAVRLRALFERQGVRPAIRAVVYNEKLVDALQGVKNFKNQSYDIEFIGDVQTRYGEDVIIGNEMEQEALACHLKYGAEEDFWRFEYNYDSSVATAIHKRARIACGFLWAAKKEEDLTIEERAELECIEHRRWNAYMRACGYVYSGSKDAASRNDLAKMHHNLVPFDDLSEEDKRKDSRVGSN